MPPDFAADERQQEQWVVGSGGGDDSGELGHLLIMRIVVVATIVGATLAIIDGSGGSTSVGRDVEEGREGGRRGRAHFWVDVNGGTQLRILPSDPGYPPSPPPIVTSGQHFVSFITGHRS